MKSVSKGDIRSRLGMHLLLVALLMLMAGVTVHHNFLWRWDNLVYDAELAFWHRQVSDDIVIVTIDDESLRQLGRWPWSRSVHAELVRKIDKEAPRAIALDIIFSEPDRIDSLADVLLARAIRTSGKVVLPVYMSSQSKGAVPVEALPLPDFTEYAAAMGHVHVDIGDDGIARQVYLREGIGKPHWKHYSLAILSVAGESKEIAEDASSENYSALKWYREHPYLIPFAGPPGHFRQIGYSQVLAGEYAPGLFRDKIVLVGATAEGMVDALPTPLSGDGGVMPGVEIVANVIQGLRDDIVIRTVDRPWLTLITVLLVALPLLLYRFVDPSRTLMVLLTTILMTILTGALLIWFAGIWVAISTAVLFQLLSYPLWSWGRLMTAMRFMNDEVDRLTKRQRELSIRRTRDISEEMKFVSSFLPLNGWVLQTVNGDVIQSGGVVPDYRLGDQLDPGWNTDGDRIWSDIEYMGNYCRIGINLAPDAFIADAEQRVLDGLLFASDKQVDHEVTDGDLLQRRIDQLHNLGEEFEELRSIIDDSLAGMADGLIICNGRGTVLLANRRASWYLYNDDYVVLDGQQILELLECINIVNNGSWVTGLKRVLFEQQRAVVEAIHEDGRDLMVEISPLSSAGNIVDGFIMNLSDISLLKASERKRDESLNFLSHDLRAPLSSMMAMIELARNRQDVDSIHSMLDDMRSNTDKTMYLAEQFLQLSRATTTTKIVFHEVDFNSIVMNAVDQVWATANQQNIQIEQEFATEECWTRADADLLERALVNLLTNAVKHSDSGSVISVQVACVDNEISCCVVDNGTGIDVDELPHLFDMFRRTRDSALQARRGTGLGLAFVDAVARKHSGRVDVESIYGDGSTFCLRIPLVIDSTHDDG